MIRQSILRYEGKKNICGNGEYSYTYAYRDHLAPAQKCLSLFKYAT